MLSVQNDLRQLQLQQQMVVPRAFNNGDHRNDPFLLHSEPVSGLRIGPVLDLREGNWFNFGSRVINFVIGDVLSVFD